MNNNLQGNVSTVIAMIWTIICPYVSQYINQEAFISICGLIIILWSAYHPNTFGFLANKPDNSTPEADNGVLNPE